MSTLKAKLITNTIPRRLYADKKKLINDFMTCMKTL